GSGVTSPNTATQSSASSDLMPDSQATRAPGVWLRHQSRTASEIWSQILSGWPSVTDSDVKSRLGESMNVLLLGISVAPSPLSGTLFPGSQVLLLLVGQVVDTDAHRFELQPGDLTVDLLGHDV